jgi:hypothetical protein
MLAIVDPLCGEHRPRHYPLERLMVAIVEPLCGEYRHLHYYPVELMASFDPLCGEHRPRQCPLERLMAIVEQPLCGEHRHRHYLEVLGSLNLRYDGHRRRQYRLLELLGKLIRVLTTFYRVNAWQ